MNTVTTKYLWNLILAGLIKPAAVDFDSQHSQMFEEDIELPSEIETKLNQYFDTHEKTYLLEAAVEVVKSFQLTSQNPDAHLILVTFLLKDHLISTKEACSLVQANVSNFSLLSMEGQDIVRLAETVEEEQKIGFMAIDSDDFLESNLLDFCQQKGFFF
jgi:hypothetical protein